MKANPSGFPLLSQTKPWDINNNPIWLASTLSLQRNIEKFKFPGKLDSERKKQIISLISKDLLTMPEFAKAYIAKGEELTNTEKEFIVEHFLSSQNYNQAYIGEAFLLEESGEFLATINMKDHLHLQFVDCKGELENTWMRLVKIETTLGKNLSYSFMPKFGFLTADPTQCGTGLIVTAYLQVPGLIHCGKIDDVLEKHVDEMFTITGIQGNPTEIVGDILMIQNNFTLGITEENIISALRSFITKLMVEENSIRNTIKKTQNADLKDKISRAYGILNHSYQIEAVEALNALSLIKLGIDAQWISGTDNARMNRLFFNCRRAHLLCQYKEKINQEEIAHKRAEHIHETFKDVKLLI